MPTQNHLKGSFGDVLFENASNNYYAFSQNTEDCADEELSEGPGFPNPFSYSQYSFTVASQTLDASNVNPKL